MMEPMTDQAWPDGLPAPARRALEAAGFHQLRDLAGAPLLQIGDLRGVGPKSIQVLSHALDAAGTPFAGVEEAYRQWRDTARPGAQKWAGSGRRGGAPKQSKAELGEPVHLDVDGRDVRLSSPNRVYFPDHGWTKLDVAQYYLAVGPGILQALRNRPTMLHRFPDGLAGEKVYQKRLPKGAPDWVPTVRLHFPRFDQFADELCPAALADIVWAVQMATVEFHPWNVRAADLDRPDEWRIDLDPMDEASFDDVRAVAAVAHDVLDDLGIRGYPKTSGGHGMHIDVRIRPDWEFADVRRAAWGFASEVVSRIPDRATVAWWRKDRDPRHVFIDFNQNARDHTLAAAYSLRGLPPGTVSAPFAWEELDRVEPGEFTLATVPQRFATIGDPRATIDDEAFGLETLLDWADRYESAQTGPDGPAGGDGDG